jgi:hypothetical protein
MLVNSESVINNYLVKYVNDPYASHCDKRLRVERFSLYVEDEILKTLDEDDINYVLILSHMSKSRIRAFLRFYSVYLYRIYNIKKQFHHGEIHWGAISEFVNSNESYKQLLLCCLNVFI